MEKKAKKGSENTHMQDIISRRKGEGDTNVRLKA